MLSWWAQGHFTGALEFRLAGRKNLYSYFYFRMNFVLACIVIRYEFKYEGESIIIRNAVAFMFLLAALSFSRASLGVVFFLSQLCRFEVAQSVPLSQP